MWWVTTGKEGRQEVRKDWQSAGPVSPLSCSLQSSSNGASSILHSASSHTQENDSPKVVARLWAARAARESLWSRSQKLSLFVTYSPNARPSPGQGRSGWGSQLSPIFPPHLMRWKKKLFLNIRLLTKQRGLFIWKLWVSEEVWYSVCWSIREKIMKTNCYLFRNLNGPVKHNHYFLFFPFIFISWRLITLQYCSGFCHTLTWISHGFTCVPHPDPPSHLPLHPIPLGLPSAPALSTCLMHPTWAGDLFHTW